MPTLAGIPASVSGRAGGPQRPAGFAAPARIARLRPAPACMPPLSAPWQRLLARWLVATALPSGVASPTSYRYRAAHRTKPLLSFSGNELAVAAIALGAIVFCLGRLGLCVLGRVRAGQRRRAGPLADRLFCPQPWRAALFCRWRCRARAQYPLHFSADH